MLAAITLIMSLVPGSIIEPDKAADEALETFVNNKATSTAAKVGENLGVTHHANSSELNIARRIR